MFQIALCAASRLNLSFQNRDAIGQHRSHGVVCAVAQYIRDFCQGELTRVLQQPDQYQTLELRDTVMPPARASRGWFEKPDFFVVAKSGCANVKQARHFANGQRLMDGIHTAHCGRNAA